MIDIYTFITKGSTPYAEFLGENLHKTKSKENLVRYWFLKDELCDSEPKNWKCAGKIIPPKDYTASARHGHMINQVKHHIKENSDIVIISDSDIGILQYNWDVSISKILENKKVAVTPKFSGATAIFFTAFRTKDFLEQDIDFRPGNKGNGFKPTTKFNDTGWRIINHFSNSEIRTYKYVQDMSAKFHFLYILNKKPFITHFSGSRKYDFKSEEVQTWINNINKHLDNAI